MAQSELNLESSRPFEALRRESSYTSSRRARPPDLALAMDATERIPLRPQKASKRESTFGLRNIFSRSKSSKETETTQSQYKSFAREGETKPVAAVTTSQHRSGPLSNLSRSQTSLTLSSQNHLPPPPTLRGAPPPTLRTRSSNGTMKVKSQPTQSRHSRAHFASWDLPPLFKAFPQGIKDAHLPAPVMSADAILRYNDKKLGGSDSVIDLSEELNAETGADRLKWRHRRDPSTSLKLDWTTKVFVLCTSGYLLQYAGEGNFDRLPDKVLQLGSESAAFVSDAIPGRHWVLQVSSVMEADGTAATDSRSLLSRLPFVGSQSRSASNFLMVFECAEDMESWINILRKEIEILGGKKTTSETGKPKVDDDGALLRARTSQRTLVVRDPERFSRVLSQDFSAQQIDAGEATSGFVDQDNTPDPSVDDVSTTNSVVSNEGQQLDSLRDSGNRSSFVSSGQRTIVTPTNSSPACSPVRDSFNVPEAERPVRETALQPRPRPNAAAILDRRQSMQAMNVMDFRQGGNATQPHRPPSTLNESSRPLLTPNFSVPISKRYSQLKASPSEPNLSTGEFTRPVRPPRGPPPSAPFSTARPLSIVADYPSPDKSDFELSNRDDSRTLSSSASSRHSGRWSRSSYHEEQPFAPELRPLPPRRTSLMPVPPGLNSLAPNPRKSVSMHALRPLQESEEGPVDFQPLISSTQHERAPQLGVPEPEHCPQRCTSPMDDRLERSRSPSLHELRQRAKKRSSVFIESTTMHPVDKPTRYSMSHATDIKINVERFESTPSLSSPNLLPVRAAPVAPSGQYLRAYTDLQAKTLFNRRSMPSLAQGPPPAPPPTSALPPIPAPPPTCALPPLPPGRTNLPGGMI